MPRSAGVTASAVVVIIGSAFTLLCAAMMVLGSALVSKSSPAANVPINIGAILLVEAAIVCGFGAWGLAAGIGLLYQKRWAWISILVFAAILVVFTLPGALFIAFIPFPKTNDPNLPVNFMVLMRFGMVFFYIAFAALGGFWLYFFNKRAVKAQFQGTQPAPESAAGDSFLGAAAPAIPDSGPSPGARPLVITIIGWYLLISAAFGALGVLFSSSFFPGQQFPLYFLGFFVFGRIGILVFIVWMAAQMAAAVGLLKLKKWGLFATIALQCLVGLNAVLLISISGHRAKFQQIMETMMWSVNGRMLQPVPFPFPVWIGFAMSLPIVFVIFYFLITRRHAFTSAAQGLASKTS